MSRYPLLSFTFLINYIHNTLVFYFVKLSLAIPQEGESDAPLEDPPEAPQASPVSNQQTPIAPDQPLPTPALALVQPPSTPMATPTQVRTHFLSRIPYLVYFEFSAPPTVPL